jgi:hypothetical protein
MPPTSTTRTLLALTCLLAARAWPAAAEQATASDLAASATATALAAEASAASRARLCKLANQYGVQDLAACVGERSV